jgi:hypothetical protein
MLEAFAEELEQFYHMMLRGILEGIDTAIYNSFDFPPLPPIASSGQLLLSLVVAGTTTPIAPTSAIVIPAGTRFQVPSTGSTVTASSIASVTYSVVSDTVWPAGATSQLVMVISNTAGIVGNAVANTITVPVDNLPVVADAVYVVTNQFPFVNGADQESSASQKVRFAAYLQSLSRGTLGAIEYGASLAVVTDSNGNIIEQVKSCTAVEPYVLDGSNPIGHVNIYIYNGLGSTSAALVANCQNIIYGYIDSDGNRLPGYKAAGIVATTIAATEQPQNFVLQTTWLSGYILDSNAEAAIAASVVQYMSTLKPGDSLIYNELISLVMGQNGMYNCVLSTPSGDVIPGNSQTVIKAGTITIS